MGAHVCLSGEGKHVRVRSVKRVKGSVCLRQRSVTTSVIHWGERRARVGVHVHVHVHFSWDAHALKQHFWQTDEAEQLQPSRREITRSDNDGVAAVR